MMSEYTEFLGDNPQPKPTPKPEPESHTHTWDLLEIWIPDDVQYHPRIAPSPKTVVLMICKTCNLPQTAELKGKWTLQQLRNAQAAHENE